MPRFATLHGARRLLTVGFMLAGASDVLSAQRRPVVTDSVTRATIDSFVITVRDMAAWAIVTPAAHVPVGAMQNATGYVESVVGAQNANTTLTTDSALVPFRHAIGAGARERKAQAIGVGYLRSVTPPGSEKPVGAVVVEVEHRSGYRATVVFPFDVPEDRPVFRASYTLPATLYEFGDGSQKKRGASRRRPRSNDDPR